MIPIMQLLNVVTPLGNRQRGEVLVRNEIDVMCYLL